MRAGAAAMGYTLDERQLQQFERYYELLVEWNEKMNLTAITQKEEVAAKHFLDSLAGAARVKAMASDRPTRLIDVGTGAGFPGIPLKILFPELSLTLLDSLQKRVRFLEAVAEELQLEEVCCIHGRAEELAHRVEYREVYDVTVARAVAPMAALVEYCGGFVRPGGVILAYKGPSLPQELSDAQPELKRLRLQCKQIEEAPIPGTDMRHFIAVVEKTGKWALQYPRKQSKIKKPIQ